MDIERSVISRALASEVVPFIEAGITGEFFPTGDHQVAWHWLVEYWREHGETPTVGAFRLNFPAASYRLVKVAEPNEFLIKTLRSQRKRGMLDQGMIEAVELTRKTNDTEQIFDRIKQLVAEIGTEVTVLKDVNLIETWKQRLEEYEELKKLPGGMRGITFGFPGLDTVTSGAQSGQLITYIGEPKAGKSTLLLRSAIAAHQAGNHVLFIGFEMSNDEQAARFDSMVGKVDHARLLTGKLSAESEQRLEKNLRKLADVSDTRFTLSQDTTSATTVSGLSSKVQLFSPDILFVDGAYLMDDDLSDEEKGSPRHLTNITRALKRLAQQMDIPVVITTQVLTWKMKRKGGLTGDAIGYSSSFAQDSDLIVGLENTEEDNIKIARIVLSRNTARLWTKIRWDWTRGDFEEMPGSGNTLGNFDEEEDDESAGDTRL